MYNEVKINMIDDDCDCEYVISEAGTAVTPFVYIRMYLGDIDFSAVEIRATYNGGTEWALPEVSGVEELETGWYMTRLSYSDFSKTGEYELEVRAYYNGEMYGNKTLYFFHSNLQSEGEWNLSKQHGVIRDAYNVQQGSTAGGGGGGGGGTTYTAGQGIEISDSNEIKTKIDNSTIQYDENDNMYVPTVPLSLENAIVIQEADASYLLHEYTEVKYIDGNRICYTGPESFIIIQGIVSYARGGTAPNGVKVAEVSSKEPDEFPDIPTYGSMLFGEMGVLDVSGDSRYVSGFEVSITRATSTFNEYRLAFKTATVDGGESTGTYGYTKNVYDNDCGVTFVWNSIFPPGTYEAVENTISKNFPYGYAVGRLFIKRKISSSSNYYSSEIGTADCALPFASEAEYNAAVGLTYEANTLTAVQETTTEV